jgi:putative SOS response-associated peptidase YedK
VCGRFTLKTPLGAWLFKIFGEEFPLEMPPFIPRYNIAPTQNVLVVSRDVGFSLRVSDVRWGLVPSWASQIPKGPPIINARSETIETKPLFRDSFQRNSCIILADGYYEWQVVGNRNKQPFWIHRSDEQPFLMAGLLSENRRLVPSQTVCSTAIVTKPSLGELAKVHDRMPLILANSNHLLQWLSNDRLSTASFFDLCQEDLAGYLKLRPVSNRVGKVTTDDPSCLNSISILHQRTLDIEEPVVVDILAKNPGQPVPDTGKTPNPSQT